MEDKIKKLEQELQQLKEKEILYLKRKEELEIFKSTFDIEVFFKDKLFYTVSNNHIKFLEFKNIHLENESPIGLFLVIEMEEYNDLNVYYEKNFNVRKGFDAFLKDKKNKIEGISNKTRSRDYVLIYIKNNEIIKIVFVDNLLHNQIKEYCEAGTFRSGILLNTLNKHQSFKDIKKAYSKVYNHLYLTTKNIFEGENTDINFDDSKQLVINPYYERIITELKSKIPNFNDIKMLEAVSLYYFYNDNCELYSLETYESNYDKGITFSVVGLGGDSDYEPYVTHFELEWVEIDWKRVLYPIRDRLKNVLKTAEQLKNLGITKNSWYVHYNNSFYDAYFQSITLDNTWIKQINKIIQNNLK